MNNIKMPDNEWLTGKLYIYNKNQDQTRKEIKRLIDASEFTEDDDYDTEGYLTIPIEVRYKQYVDRTERGGYAAGVAQKVKNKQIEVTDTTIDLKYNDRFKTMDMTDEEKGYKVMNVDNNRNAELAMATYMLPGLYEEYNSNTIVTLQ